MKTNLYIELQGQKVEAKHIENVFKEMWKDEGGRIKDLKDVDLYYKPDENACYYFIPETKESGSFTL